MQYKTASKKWLDLLGFDIRNISLENESITCTISFPEKLTGNDGIIHGGMTCFIIDSIAGIHGQMFLDKSGTVLTKNLLVDFLRPIIPNEIYVLSSYLDNRKIVVEISQEEKVFAKGVVEVVFK